MAKMESALAATLRTLREQHGLTQRAVAQTLNTNQATIARWENVTNTPSPTVLSNLAAVYETTPSHVYETAESEAMQERAKQLEQTINMKRKAYGDSHKDKKKK